MNAVTYRKDLYYINRRCGEYRTEYTTTLLRFWAWYLLTFWKWNRFTEFNVIREK